MFHNILVCVDGSSHSQCALQEAIDLALAGRGRLTLLTAVTRPPYWAASPVTAGGIESLTAELESEAEDTIRAATDQVPESVPVTTILTRQPIREALLSRLKTGDYDLLVMGSRGRGALTASVLGSVSHFALNHSPIPVLIVHTRDEHGAAQLQSSGAPAAAAA